MIVHLYYKTIGSTIKQDKPLSFYQQIFQDSKAVSSDLFIEDIHIFREKIKNKKTLPNKKSKSLALSLLDCEAHIMAILVHYYRAAFSSLFDKIIRLQNSEGFDYGVS